jgi:putative endonuclease
MSPRRRKGSRAHAFGTRSEDAACAALAQDGWTVLGRRVRTEAGELDILGEKDGLLAVIEVKARPTLADAAVALSPRQQARLLAAAEIVVATHPGWGINGVRFDLMVVDGAGAVRRISDAFRVAS